MSNKQTEVTMNEVVVTNPLAARIVKILKMDDGSKVEKFLSREIKAQQRAITDLESNRKTAQLGLDGALAKIADQIEDATVAVSEAYEAITIGDVKTNESMDNFSSLYWGRIKSKEDTLESLTKRQESLQKDFDKEVEEIDKQIAKRKERIAKIS